MPTYSSKQNRENAARWSRLRKAGVPAMLTAHEAYYLSGGVRGTADDHETSIPSATVAAEVPDCEAFLPDFLEIRRGRTRPVSSMVEHVHEPAESADGGVYVQISPPRPVSDVDPSRPTTGAGEASTLAGQPDWFETVMYARCSCGDRIVSVILNDGTGGLIPDDFGPNDERPAGLILLNSGWVVLA